MQKYYRDAIQERCKKWCENNSLDFTVENLLCALDVLGLLSALDSPCEVCKGSGLDFTLGQVGTCNICGGKGLV
jgi:hypothetical protein